jgi:UDP-2,3-diacylglucosamine pyrophosphatase LpxH
MTEPVPGIAEILLRCEENGSAPPYVYSDAPKQPASLSDSQGPRVAISAHGAEVFVVSDLHLAAGVGPDGRCDGTENFFFDASFHRFLRHAHAHRTSPNALLIINGDFIDFLRITYVPGVPKRLTRWEKFLKRLKVHRRARRLQALSDTDREAFRQDFVRWSQILAKIGIQKSPEELVQSISDKEEIYGLKTHDYKSVLRLDLVLQGHAEFFEALAEWLGWGHRIIIVKGNHDLEWYWRAVRNYLRLDLAERLARQRPGEAAGTLRHTLLQTVLPNLTFIDHAMLIDGDVYVEHGHPYDPLTRVIGSDTVNNGEELNIPFGSFFNRYLLNLLEADYPYLDNIRPTKNILPLMLRHRFLTGLRLLIDHLIVIAKTIPKQYISYIFGQHLVWRVLLILLVTLGPPAWLLWHQSGSAAPGFIKILEWIAWLAAAYALIQLLAYAQLQEPDTLAQFARQQFAAHKDYRIITFGHTHNPDQFRAGDRWFYNTGTWIPMVETTTANVREDRTFTYLHLTRDAAGRLAPGVLRRWDDEAGRSEPMVLIRGIEA